MHVLSMRMVHIGHFVEYVIMIWEKTGFRMKESMNQFKGDD